MFGLFDLFKDNLLPIITFFVLEFKFFSQQSNNLETFIELDVCMQIEYYHAIWKLGMAEQKLFGFMFF